VTTTDPLRILTLHSAYRSRGGEDESFAAEVAVLRDLGHEVVELVRQAADLARGRPAAQARQVVWNTRAAGDLTALVHRFRPDVAYVNNFFPALSASCLDALGRCGVPTVVAVRNHRLACVNGLVYRDGAACSTCLGRTVPVPAVRHACYRGTAASAVAVGALLAVRRTLARHAGTMWFAPISDYLYRFVVGLGIPADHVTIKPDTMGSVPPARWSADDYLLLAGRIEPEKGTGAALDAVRDTPGARLRVVGTGSDQAQAGRADLEGRVEFLGWRPHPETLRLMAGARATLVPSLMDEAFGRVAMESLACGTPVVVSDRGGLRDVPEPGVSGLVIDPTDRRAFAGALARLQHEDWWRGGARRAARARFDACFSPAVVGPIFDGILRSAAAGRPR
jgi:glycosyltransferase involved in cell wall biosynthesis